MTFRKIGMALMTASLIVFGVFTPTAHAADPVTIPPGTFVVDESDVLSDGEEGELEDHIGQLQSEHGATLFVIYVPTFENPADPEDWVQGVAEENRLGTNDNILAVSTEDRRYNFVTHSSGPFRDYQADIDREYILPALSNDDWLGAGQGAVTGLAEAADGAAEGHVAPGTTEQDTGGGGGGGFLWFLIPIGILIAFLIWRAADQKKRQRSEVPQAGPTDPRDAIPVDELRTRAGSALIEADDAIKTAEQEIGFAQAAYGDAAVELFQRDVQEAKEHMQQSFQLQHQLDDHIPDSEADQRAWLKEILDRSAQVMTSLQEHEQDFAQLRDLEKTAPEALQRVSSVFAPLPARLDDAAATIERLSSSYDGPAFVEGQQHLEQARGLVDFGQEKLDEAQTALRQGDRSTAAWNIHEAENTTQELEEILDSIHRLPAELDTAQRQLSIELEQARTLLGEAREFAAQHRTDANLSGGIAALERAVETIDYRLPSRQPFKDLENLENAHDPLTEQLEPLRTQQQRIVAARQDFEPTLAKARTTIDAADDYIRHRRGAVRHEARTKLSAAQTHFNTALTLQDNDPIQAVTEAQQALHLGRLAQQLAEQNYDDFGHYHRGGGGRDSNWSAMLGGVLLGHILGGGGGSWGGSGGGFSGGGGGGFFGGSGGSFGGGGGFGGGSGGSF